MVEGGPQGAAQRMALTPPPAAGQQGASAPAAATAAAVASVCSRVSLDALAILRVEDSGDKFISLAGGRLQGLRHACQVPVRIDRRCHKASGRQGWARWLGVTLTVGGTVEYDRRQAHGVLLQRFGAELACHTCWLAMRNVWYNLLLNAVQAWHVCHLMVDGMVCAS